TSSACFILEGLLCRGGSWEHHDRCTAVQASTRSAAKPGPPRGGPGFAAERLPERSEAIVDADHAGARLVGASTVGQARDDDLFIEHVVDLDEGGHAFIDGVARDPVDHEQGLGAIEGVTGSIAADLDAGLVHVLGDKVVVPSGGMLEAKAQAEDVFGNI